MTKTSLTPHRGHVSPSRTLNWELDHLGRDMDRLFGEFFSPRFPTRMFRFPEEWGGTQFSPRCDVEDRENEFVLTAEVPGYNREDLHVDVSGENLTLRGEHKQESEQGDTRYVCRESCRGMFERTMRLPAEIDVEHVEAKLKDGILTLTLPKLHTVEHRHIEVSEE